MRHTNSHSVLQKLWVLCCTLVLVFSQTNASAQVFQNTLMLQSTDEYCAGLSGYDTPTNNATRFYMSVGNTTTGSPAGSTLNRILLTKYDVNGNILWTKTIHVPGANSSWYATDIQAGFNTTTTEISSTTVLPTPTPIYGMDDATIAVPNNQSVYYISGYTLYRIPNTTTTIKRMILVKVDATGNVLWTRTNFTNSNTFDEAGVSVETAPNGDVFIVGSARNTSNNRYHVSVGRVRSNGTLVWFNRYANSTNVAQSMNPKQSITTKDLVVTTTATGTTATYQTTGIAITGEYRNASVATSVNRAFTMRIYFNGTEVWRRAQALSGTQTSSGQDLIVDPVSNNLTVVGYNGTVSTNTARTIFWQLSGAGNQIASIVYNNPNQASHYAQSIVPALSTGIAGGGFAVAGSIRVSNAGAVTANRTYLLQLAANGAPNWMRYYQRTTPRFNATESVVSSLSGYYLSTNATKTGTADAHAIATDPAGMLPAASPTDCREIDASLTAQNLGDFTTIPLGQTPTTPISNVTLTAVTIDHPEDRCAPVTVVCPNCNDFSVSIGSCTYNTATGTSTRQASFGLLCTIPAGATGTMTWSFGDGSPNYTGALASVIHNYAPGTYSVCAYGTIVLADGTQCPFDYCKTIVVEACPNVCPTCNTINATVACVQTPASTTLVPQATLSLGCTFPSGSTGTVTWTWGDGSPSLTVTNLSPVTHIYAPGTYNVCASVTVTLPTGQVCTYQFCRSLVVEPCPSPCPNCNDFSVSIGNCVYNGTAAPTRQVGLGLLCTIPTGATGTMTWSFGDGSPNYTGSLASVIHNYAPGTYSVCAYGTIVLANGTQCPFDYCKTIVILPCDNLCPTCTDMTVTQGDCVTTAGSITRQVGFSMNCAIPTGATVNATWSWGDGSANYTYSGPPISVIHNYAAGTYNVCTYGTITLSNGQICPFEICKTIVVEPCVNPCPNCNDFSVTISGCDSSTDPSTRQVGLGLLCTIPTGATGTMTWSFGDGSPNYTGALASVIHNYVPGTYSVCAYGVITLANGTQCPFDYCKTIVIEPCVSPCPTCNTLIVTQGDCTYNAATNTSTRQMGFSMNCAIPSGATVNATWSWGDGSANYTYSGLPISVIHNYAAGTYNVCTYGNIVLANGQQCPFQICQTIVVEACPNLCPTCNNLTVTQGDCSTTATGSITRQIGLSMTCAIPTGATVNATWIWGDGSANYTYSGPPISVIHNYAPGTYNVCTYGNIVLSNGQTCPFEFCKSITVEPCPTNCPTCNTINATVACVQVAGSTTLVPQATLSLGCTFPTGSTGTVTWIWGDGSASQTVGNLSPVTHIYAPGTYNVCVSVTVNLSNGQVCTYQFCRSLTVTGCTSGCPTCQLSWQVACCTPPPPVPISNPINYTATFALGCNIPTSAIINWSFGDGANQTGASTITHTYGAAGTYNVCAIVTSGDLTCDYCTSITIASTLCASPIPTCSTNPGGKTTVTETWKFGVNVAPNPFANNTNIQYSLPEATAVTIEVYSITGQKVATLANNEQHEAGAYTANFDATNLTAGTYYCTVQAGKYSVVKPLVLIK